MSGPIIKHIESLAFRPSSCCRGTSFELTKRLILHDAPEIRTLPPDSTLIYLGKALFLVRSHYNILFKEVMMSQPISKHFAALVTSCHMAKQKKWHSHDCRHCCNSIIRAGGHFDMLDPKQGLESRLAEQVDVAASMSKDLVPARVWHRVLLTLGRAWVTDTTKHRG